MKKSIFKSKVFWVNLITGSADVFQVIPLPQGWSVPVLAMINIGLRFLTEKPVNITGNAEGI